MYLLMRTNLQTAYIPLPVQKLLCIVVLKPLLEVAQWQRLSRLVYEIAVRVCRFKETRHMTVLEEYPLTQYLEHKMLHQK